VKPALRIASRRLALCALLGATPRGHRARATPSQPHRAIDRLLDQPPFDRGTWAVIVCDSSGRVQYERNADRLMVPASTNKLLVSAAAMTLLGPEYRVTTSAYVTGRSRMACSMGTSWSTAAATRRSPRTATARIRPPENAIPCGPGSTFSPTA